jgi:nucleoside-diphosphate-sugar epimerase
VQAKPVLVTGGTGTLGRYVVDRLVATGRPTRVLSRRSHGPSTGAVAYVQGDLRTGDGVERAVAGCDILVHCAGAATGDTAR